MSNDVIHDLTLLRVPFRERLEDLLGMLAKEAIPLAVYESVRCPIRQSRLYLIGRNPLATGFGRTVTGAEAYESAHQYGLAADLVFRVNGKPKWEEPEWGLWARYGELAKAAGLQTLRKEKPHVQMDGPASALEYLNRHVGAR